MEHSCKRAFLFFISRELQFEFASYISDDLYSIPSTEPVMKLFVPLLAVLAFTLAGVGCKSTCCGTCGGDAAAKACPAGCDKPCCKKS